MKIHIEKLDFDIRINNRIQKFITFENDYMGDEHLIKAVDFLVIKIKTSEEKKYSNPIQHTPIPLISLKFNYYFFIYISNINY